MKRLFRQLSRLRRKRVFHPCGVGFRGILTPLGAAEVPAFASPSEPLVRLSRSFGLPEWLPDPCGLAFRIPDAHGPERHQDLLLVSSASARGGRHSLLPSRGFCDRPYSAILPYRLRGRPVMLGARALAPAPGPKLAELRARAVGGSSSRSCWPIWRDRGGRSQGSPSAIGSHPSRPSFLPWTRPTPAAASSWRGCSTACADRPTVRVRKVGERRTPSGDPERLIWRREWRVAPVRSHHPRQGARSECATIRTVTTHLPASMPG